MAKQRKIKVGTIGYGAQFGMGHHHLTLMRDTGVFVPTAVCDVDASRLAFAREEFPEVETFTDYHEMLRKSDVELIVVILPHNLHAPVTVDVLKAGRHAVVEKPFALSVKECDRMIAAAEKAGVMLSCFHNRHWDGNIMEIMKLLPKIGRPVRWESQHGGWSRPRDWWRSDKAVAGGIVFDWGAHFTEWMLQVMNDGIAEVSGFVVDEVWSHCTLEDEMSYVVRFANGALGNHTQSAIDMAPKPRVRITGTKGVLIESGKSIELHERRRNGTTVVTSYPVGGRATNAYYRNVADHLTQGAPLVITAEWARRVIQVLDDACQSAESGKAVKPKYA